MPESVSIHLPGPFDYYDSYGLIGCQLARHLDRLGVQVSASGTGERYVDNQPADVRRVLERERDAGPGGLLLGYPTTYERFAPDAQYGPRVAITMFESSRIPTSWLPMLNGIDAMVVPSTFCRDVFKRAGVTAPIHVIPLGISETYQPAQRPPNRKPYTFLAWGDRGKRKGQFEAIQAFYRAFGEDMDYRLIIKARDLPAHALCTNPNVETMRMDMTEKELYELFLSCDCMVFPTRGEGFGLPPREFAATGAPVIATDWSGTADDIESWGIPLDYTLQKADWLGVRSLKGYDLGVWAIPDVDHLTSLMRLVADNRATAAQRALERAHRLHDLYSWRRFAEGVLSVWRDVVEEVSGARAYA